MRNLEPVWSIYTNRYMLAEHQHMSFLFDIAFEDIFRYIYKIIRSEELIKKYMGKRIYTGYYYSTDELYCKKESTINPSEEKYPIFLYFTSDVMNSTLLASEENTGQHKIIIHTNLPNIISLWADYHSRNNGLLFDREKADSAFKE